MLVPRKSPYVLKLSADQRRELEVRARSIRCRIETLCGPRSYFSPPQGSTMTRSRRRLDMRREIVSKWRKRFYLQGLEGLEELPRAAGPRPFPPEVVVAVKAIACELPSRPSVSHCRGCTSPTS